MLIERSNSGGISLYGQKISNATLQKTRGVLPWIGGKSVIGEKSVIGVLIIEMKSHRCAS